MIVFVVICFVIIIFSLWLINAQNKVAQKLKDEGFDPDIKIDRLAIDTKNRTWTLTGYTTTYPLDDIVDCAVIEDGISYKPDHGVLRAVVGGTLFGAVGAVVGASTASSSEYINSVEVAIWKKDSLQDRPIKMSLLNSKTSKNSLEYKRAKQSAEAIVRIIDKHSGFSERKPSVQDDAVEANTSVADELEKYKKLLDTGVITQTEFDDVKSKLISKL